MALETERLEILRMVEAKQITPEDGVKLLTALGEAPRARAADGAARPGASTAADGRRFRLLVEERGGQRVNLTVPLQAVPVVLTFAARWVPPEHRAALEGAGELARSDFRGEILRLDEPGHESVRIWIE